MSRIVKCGLIQAHNVAPTNAPIPEIRQANLDHQMKMVEDAAHQGVQMLCFQEIFTTPYFSLSKPRVGTMRSSVYLTARP